MRAERRVYIMEELERYRTKPRTINQLSTFLQRFWVFKGIQTCYLNKDVHDLSRSDRESQLIDEISCKESWPICIFDFVTNHAIDDFFVFKTEWHNLNDFVIPNHFVKDEFDELTQLSRHKSEAV